MLKISNLMALNVQLIFTISLVIDCTFFITMCKEFQSLGNETDYTSLSFRIELFGCESLYDRILKTSN